MDKIGMQNYKNNFFYTNRESLKILKVYKQKKRSLGGFSLLRGRLPTLPLSQYHRRDEV